MKQVLTLASVLMALPLLIIAAPAESNYERACAVLATAKTSDTERLHQLFKLDWEHTMTESPEFATEVGYTRQDDRWSDISLAAIGCGGITPSSVGGSEY